MKFKVGDEVRLTREGMRRMSAEGAYIDDIFVDGSMIKRIKDELVCVKGTNKLIHESHFELVPEEPEFEQGEEIEVSRDGKKWEKRIYLTTINLYKKFYICVSGLSVERYNSGLSYSICDCPYARRCKPQLTRKEIAEKFGIFEDFVLVDDISSDEI